jgi:predicted transcriptional regulator
MVSKGMPYTIRMKARRSVRGGGYRFVYSVEEMPSILQGAF